jgi:hypothetical protein
MEKLVSTHKQTFLAGKPIAGKPPADNPPEAELLQAFLSEVL